MKVYFYDATTKELLGSADAFVDPMATKRLGVTTYSKPANATFVEPPTLKTYQIAIFDTSSETWSTKDTYKGQYKINVNTKIVTKITTTDPLKSYERLVTTEQYAELLEDPDKFDVIDGEFVDISKTQQYQSNYNIKKYKALIKNAEDTYDTYINTPVTYKGSSYLPRYAEDYTKLLTGSFPIEIWDSDGLTSKLMTSSELKQLKEYLENLVNVAYKRKKLAIKQYKNEITKLGG